MSNLSQWDEATDAVCARASVGAEPYAHNGNNASLAIGAAKLGIACSDIPRNCKGLCAFFVRPFLSGFFVMRNLASFR